MKKFSKFYHDLKGEFRENHPLADLTWFKVGGPAQILFIPENKRLTFGQMSQKLKFKNDHRAKAFKKIKKFL